MFLAGLEMDMEGLKKNRTRVIVFGLLTFLVPFAMTYFMGVSLLSYTPLAALLLSAIMASNTLIAYPIVGRYGLTRHTSSTLSVGVFYDGALHGTDRHGVYRQLFPRRSRNRLLGVVCCEVLCL